MAFGELELDLPQYDCEDFRTEFRPKRGPGFFPVEVTVRTIRNFVIPVTLGSYK